MSRIVRIRAGCGGKLEEARMKTLILATLFAIGVALAAPSGASAAAIGGTGVDKAAKANSPIEQVYCRWRRYCHWGPYGRRCWTRRYCW